jgi:predicted metal-dependent hydrolase
MSRLADCISMADESMAGLWQWKFQFSEDVRKAALDILTTYKGPYSRQVSASLLVY